MNYNIRKATISDLEGISNLQKDYEHILITENSLKSDLTNDRAIYFIATNNSDILGCIGGLILVDHADISIVITNKQYVKNGIAYSLLKTFIEYCKENNIEQIFLEVRSSNTAAIQLYEKSGFNKIHTRKNYYNDNNEDALIYIKNIAV